MLRQNCTKIVYTQKLLFFVSGFLSVSNVGNKGCKKKSVKEGEWLYDKKMRIIMCEILSHKEEKNICMPGLKSTNFC